MKNGDPEGIKEAASYVWSLPTLRSFQDQESLRGAFRWWRFAYHRLLSQNRSAVQHAQDLPHPKRRIQVPAKYDLHQETPPI